MSSLAGIRGRVYRALDHTKDEFRLLYLKPTSVSSDFTSQDNFIDSELQYYRLRDAPAFTALSYTWGQALSHSFLVIDGNVQRCSVNAELALRHLRKEDGVHIWIDQLCINQSDDIEKGYQVQMMLQIYIAASRVAVWLGLGADDSDSFISHIPLMSTLIRDGQFVDVVRGYADADYLQRMIHAFRAFLKREYWTRLWIIQEFAVARELYIVCGKTSIEFTDLRVYLVFLNQIYEYVPVISSQGDPVIKTTFVEMMRGFSRIPEHSFLAGVLTRRRRYQMKLDSTTDKTSYTVTAMEAALLKGGESLFAVLATTLVLEIDYNHTKVTDARDRVFAVMQFADDVEEFSSLPSYTASCETVYEDVARHMITQGHIDLLSYCQFPQETKLATWAPDWRIGIKRPCVGAPWFSKFNSSNYSAADQVIEISDTETLLLRGVFVDLISETRRVWDPNWISELDYTAALAYINDVDELCTKSPYFSDKIKNQNFTDIMRICIADRYNYREPGRHGELIQGFKEAFTHIHAKKDENTSNTAAVTQSDDSTKWTRLWFIHAMQNLHTRRPFISKSGYVGLAPMHAQKGDMIVIFLGGKSPYVIRRTNDTYHLIGEAYVHEIMYGEFMNNKLDVRVFSLS